MARRSSFPAPLSKEFAIACSQGFIRSSIKVSVIKRCCVLTLSISNCAQDIVLSPGTRIWCPLNRYLLAF
ncbi:Uncharacterized protein HZ326_17431 [Fusarium oxysporum f. sp. albedinis]|nr:Uncharacterized protein HZ326_17431 [Fusarium oxysporum f. sp. albedinis]